MQCCRLYRFYKARSQAFIVKSEFAVSHVSKLALTFLSGKLNKQILYSFFFLTFLHLKRFIRCIQKLKLRHQLTTILRKIRCGNRLQLLRNHHTVSNRARLESKENLEQFFGMLCEFV